MEALKHYETQTYTNFEVIIAASYKFSVPQTFARVVVDRSLKGQVSLKRNMIMKYGTGSIYVFHDDDVYVPDEYMANVVALFNDEKLVAACGPLLTPPNDTFMEQAGGLVWESYIGSMGAGIYRSRIMPPRIVRDYPAANLVVRADIFKKIGGYEQGIYPGEDTKLLIDIFNLTGKWAYYHPDLTSYHHRKALFKKHLIQIGRYGYQRGQFSLAYPTTSFKIQYFLPAMLLLYELAVLAYVFLASPVYNLSIFKLAIAPFALYMLLLFLETCYIVYVHGFSLGLVASLGIVATHVYYGYKFILGFATRVARRIGAILDHI